MALNIRIAIDCRITDSKQGIGTALQSLAKGLSASTIQNQQYTFIVRECMRNWLAPYVYGPCKLAGIPDAKSSYLKNALRGIAPLRYAWNKVRGTTTPIPVSDDYVESHHFDLVHFPTQLAYLTEVPSIYQPWDLQHLHYPEFFSTTDVKLRESQYRCFCDRASYVCVQAEWTKRDIIRHYGVASDKIIVVPWGSELDEHSDPSGEETRTTVEKYDLPKVYFFYPAVTWPHKNHEEIYRALHILRSEYDTTPDVCFTGSSTIHRSTLDKLATGLGISAQVHFLGFVTPTELQVIYKSATALLFPSRFEGFGLPILEAFRAGLPVLSSNATTLPEVGRDAALYFDPNSPRELAALMKSVLDSPELRGDMIQKGTRALSHFSINETIAQFQALYERTSLLSL